MLICLYIIKVVHECTLCHPVTYIYFFFAESDRCPVRSFVKYIRRLNPKCTKLFQQSRSYPRNNIFYDNVALGHNRLGQFMSESDWTF